MIEMSECCLAFVGARILKVLTYNLEIILATVLSKMYFEPTEDEIIWNLSQIISPSVQKDGGKEEKGMPVRAVLDDLTG